MYVCSAKWPQRSPGQRWIRAWRDCRTRSTTRCNNRLFQGNKKATQGSPFYCLLFACEVSVVSAAQRPELPFEQIGIAQIQFHQPAQIADAVDIDMLALETDKAVLRMAA